MGNLFSTENLANSAFFQPPCALKNASIILSEWGRINYNYAESLMKIECGDEQTSLHDLYQSVFGSYPTLNLVGNLFSFFKKSSDYRLCYHPQNQDRNHTEVFDSPDGCESTFSME